MSPFIRWILSILLALVMLFFIVGVGFFGYMASPVMMALGVIVAAVLFGLNKRWQLWLGLLAIGGALGMCGYVPGLCLSHNGVVEHDNNLSSRCGRA